MESETNKEIREILEKFGVNTKEVIENFSIIGHLSQVADNHYKRELKRKIDLFLSVHF